MQARIIVNRQIFCPVQFEQVAQLSQRDRAAEWVNFGQKWKIGTGRIFCGHYRSIFNHCDVTGQLKKLQYFTIDCRS